MVTQSHSAAPDTPVASVLVVEDDADDLRALREILERERYHVEGAANGSIALGRLLSGPPPDLVLVDLFMPVMDGWRFIAEMKARPDLAVIPVVVVSGGGERTLSSAPVSAGYLQKPIHPARLVETLSACLARREQRRSGIRSAVR